MFPILTECLRLETFVSRQPPTTREIYPRSALRLVSRHMFRDKVARCVPSLSLKPSALNVRSRSSDSCWPDDTRIRRQILNLLVIQNNNTTYFPWTEFSAFGRDLYVNRTANHHNWRPNLFWSEIIQFNTFV